jgi:hypothetical protein
MVWELIKNKKPGINPMTSSVFKRLLLILPLLAFLWCCKEKKASLKEDDEDVEITDFIEFFPEVQLPFRIADSTLQKKQTDSALINYKVFTRFIPDSVIRKDFGRSTPSLYSLGRVTEKGKETYLFVRAVAGSKRVGYLACFNRDEQFLAMMPLIRTGFEANISSYALLDKKFQITTFRERRVPGTETSYKKNVYVFNNSSNEFMIIFTEPNEEIIKDVINPIDTLQKKHKHAGDYVVNKENFISFRDGKDPSHLLFFVHFEKLGGDCVGELKGAARIVSADKAVYREPGNPCAIEFSFSSGSVTMKEVGGCGTYRNIRCFFEGKYPKKREPKPKKK